ncbi:transporter substrate-binding domain-containing protein [Tateyamaria sp. SN3-11]|uniref:transporter substrate-binding domain-containing protein n=1 Tax=Tateyamaria sp. SN3-11 TaxID=3092147 RepID=UPI0039E8977C
MKIAYLIEPPFNFHDHAGLVTGCDVELARYVLRELGVADITFVEAEFADLLPGLTLGTWQMTTGLFATQDRRRHAIFSRPIWALPDGVLVRSADVGRITGYRSLADDDTLTLAVIRDQFQHMTALEFGVPPDRIVVCDTYLEATRAVHDGRADAYASVARAHDGYLEHSRAPGLQTVVVPVSEKPPAFGCFGFPTADTAFRNAVDEVLDAFLGGHEHRKTMKTFGFSDKDIDLVV